MSKFKVDEKVWVILAKCYKNIIKIMPLGDRYLTDDGTVYNADELHATSHTMLTEIGFELDGETSSRGEILYYCEKGRYKDYFIDGGFPKENEFYYYVGKDVKTEIEPAIINNEIHAALTQMMREQPQ